MTLQMFSKAIEMVKQKNMEEGARLLRIVLSKPETINKETQSMAWLWLAETTQSPQEKINHYNKAIAVDPNNHHAQQRLTYWLAQNAPEQPPPTQPQPQQPAPQTAQPIDYNNYTTTPPKQTPTTAPPQSTNTGNSLYRTVGIFDGPNGPGSGFFINKNGLVVTTRWVIGGTQTVTYELNRGQRAQARVVRSWPQYDLALIHTGVTIAQTLSVSTTPVLPDNTPISAMGHNGHVANGIRRATKSVIKEGWFPTTIESVPDAGGNPVFNQQNLLVGMLTRNTHPSAPYVFGLHISHIIQLVDSFTHAMQTQQNLVYCSPCGNLSRAQEYSGFYCEHCGSVLPYAEGTQRFPNPRLTNLYGENMSQPCSHCGSTVGHHRGICLRCGHKV